MVLPAKNGIDNPRICTKCKYLYVGKIILDEMYWNFGTTYASNDKCLQVWNCWQREVSVFSWMNFMMAYKILHPSTFISIFRNSSLFTKFLIECKCLGDSFDISVKIKLLLIHSHDSSHLPKINNKDNNISTFCQIARATFTLLNLCTIKAQPLRVKPNIRSLEGWNYS